MVVKEFCHIRRQPSTLYFLLVVPVMQMFLYGYAIRTEVRNIPTVVLELDRRQPARELVDAFRTTQTFAVTSCVQDHETFRRALTSGRAKVGVIVPPDYTDRLVKGQQAQVQVLIDGSDSQIANTAQHATQLLGTHHALRQTQPGADLSLPAPARDAVGRAALPVEMRTRLLYNPNLESARFFVPGMVGIILQLVTVCLVSFAIVRERELGTLEQLFVTPVSRLGLLFGKLVPYALVGLCEIVLVLALMVYLFGVPIHGNLALLLGLAGLFLVCVLGIGLLVSTLAHSQVQAGQLAFLTVLPSVLLSGFVFPREAMPYPIYVLTVAIPATHAVEILRGIVLRAADLRDLAPQVLGLTACAVVLFTASVARFRKSLG